MDGSEWRECVPWRRGGLGGWVKIHGGSGEDLDDLFEGERVVADETEGLGGEIRASGLAETGDGDDVAW